MLAQVTGRVEGKFREVVTKPGGVFMWVLNTPDIKDTLIGSAVCLDSRIVFNTCIPPSCGEVVEQYRNLLSVVSPKGESFWVELKDKVYLAVPPLFDYNYLLVRGTNGWMTIPIGSMEASKIQRRGDIPIARENPFAKDAV